MIKLISVKKIKSYSFWCAVICLFVARATAAPVSDAHHSKLSVGAKTVDSDTVSAKTTRIKGVINVEVTTYLGDAQSFAKGDVILFYVTLDKDAYLCLIYQDAANNLVQLVPNSISPTAFYPAGDYFQLPDVASGYRFKVSEPFGKEAIWLFAASKPFPALEGKRLPDGSLLLANRSFSELQNKLRNYANKEGVYYGEANTTFSTTENQRLNKKP